jgi:hypothetical protein
LFRFHEQASSALLLAEVLSLSKRDYELDSPSSSSRPQDSDRQIFPHAPPLPSSRLSWIEVSHDVTVSIEPTRCRLCSKWPTQRVSSCVCITGATEAAIHLACNVCTLSAQPKKGTWDNSTEMILGMAPTVLGAVCLLVFFPVVGLLFLLFFVVSGI